MTAFLEGRDLANTRIGEVPEGKNRLGANRHVGSCVFVWSTTDAGDTADSTAGHLAGNTNRLDGSWQVDWKPS